MNGCVFPVVGGVDALQARLPAGVRSVVTNPPYRRDLLPALVEHWLSLLEPIGGQLCLLLRSLWGESQRGQASTSKHPAYAGRINCRVGSDGSKARMKTKVARRNMSIAGSVGIGAATWPKRRSRSRPAIRACRGARYAARHWMTVPGTQSPARTAVGLREVARGGTPHVRTQSALSSRRLTRRCRKGTLSNAHPPPSWFRCWQSNEPAAASSST